MKSIVLGYVFFKQCIIVHLNIRIQFYTKNSFLKYGNDYKKLDYKKI